MFIISALTADLLLLILDAALFNNRFLFKKFEIQSFLKMEISFLRLQIRLFTEKKRIQVPAKFKVKLFGKIVNG